MWTIVASGGWLMVPIILCSIIALAIIIERLWALQKRRIRPPHLVAQVWHWEKNGELDQGKLKTLREGSALGRILSVGLANRDRDREVMKESIEESGRHVVHEMERYLNSLGTIAAITPLLGLLGTVFGMIEVFADLTSKTIGDAGSLAGGISTALITTAAGLLVAIPSLMFYRYFRGRIDEHIVAIEQEAIKLVEVMHGQRDSNAVKEDNE